MSCLACRIIPRSRVLCLVFKSFKSMFRLEIRFSKFTRFSLTLFSMSSEKNWSQCLVISHTQQKYTLTFNSIFILKALRNRQKESGSIRTIRLREKREGEQGQGRRREGTFSSQCLLPVVKICYAMLQTVVWFGPCTLLALLAKIVFRHYRIWKLSI